MHNSPLTLFSFLPLLLVFTITISIWYFLQPFDGMSIINRPIGYAQRDAYCDADTPRVKYIGKILKDVAVYPPYRSEQDYYVVEEIFGQLLPVVVHLVMLF